MTRRRGWSCRGPAAVFAVGPPGVPDRGSGGDPDLTPITSVYEQGDGRGQPPYHPVLLSKLLLHAYCAGETSSRVIMRKTYEDIGYRVLCVDQHPDFRTISDFRERHLLAFLALFKETVRLAEELGQVRLAHVAQDGSKILANASKHKAMSYARLGETEARLGQEIAEILSRRGRRTRRRMRATGGRRPGRRGRRRWSGRWTSARHGGRGFGPPRRPWRPCGSRGGGPGASGSRQHQPPHLLAAAPPPASGGAADDPPPLTWCHDTSPGRRSRTPAACGGARPDAQYNFTDPESRIMPSKDGFVQAYNGQIAVDTYRQIIVACDVTDAPNRSAPIAVAARPGTAKHRRAAWPVQRGQRLLE